jgi:alpha/beta superfamily hydrolase
MHNKVVYRTARALRKRGAVVLRFNYRGVNLSEGSYAGGKGELEDARMALAWLRQQYPGLPYSLAGFSFGSRIILQLGCELGDPKRLIALGFPASYRDRIDLSDCAVPKYFVQSTNDQYGRKEDLESYVATLPQPKLLLFVEARDHFFAGALNALEQTLMTEVP